MLAASLEETDALAARLEGIPAVVQAALAATSAEAAAQMMAAARAGAAGLSPVVEGPIIAGDRVTTVILTDPAQKQAAVQGQASGSALQRLLPSRSRAFAAVADPVREAARVAEVELASAALDAVTAWMDRQ